MNYSDYINIINNLTNRLKEVEDENLQLNNKINSCEGELKAYRQFYNDFKSNIKFDDMTIVDTPKNIDVNNNSYDELLNEYFHTENESIIYSLFDNFNLKPSQILTDIRSFKNMNNILPKNIELVCEKYNCQKEYQIIKKSIELIKTSISPDDIEPIHRLSDLYIKNYVKNNKKKSLEYLKNALIIYPFQFDIFLNDIREYSINNLSAYIENLKFKLYGNLFNPDISIVDNVNKTVNNIDDSNIKKRKKGRPKGSLNIKTLEKNNKTIDDKKGIEKYRNLSINELVDVVKNTRVNKRNKALLLFDYLTRLNKNEEFCYDFVGEVNKILTKKI